MINSARKNQINRTINSIFRQINVQFPLDIDAIIKRIPNCKMMSYEYFAKVTNCREQEVARICQSQSGCTHLDRDREKYLILYNQKQKPQRILWTKAHEVGHIALNHFNETSVLSLSLSDFSPENKLKEQEADYFAANLLAPMWALKKFDVKYAGDIQNIFGLSQSASEHRLVSYKKYNQHF